jgi:hypothetical protein
VPVRVNLATSGRRHIYKTRLNPCFAKAMLSDNWKFKAEFGDLGVGVGVGDEVFGVESLSARG